jgi:hypothetical protein
MYDQLAIKPFRLPSEKKLTYIERGRGITIQRDAFASKDYYNTDHYEGRDHPVRWSNNGEGAHVPLVEIDKLIYVVGKHGGNTRLPIPLSSMNEGRKIERTIK